MKRRDFLKTATKAAWVAPALVSFSANGAFAQVSPAPGVAGTGAADGAQVLGAGFTVDGRPLPKTGADPASLVAAGLASIGVGTAAVRVSRRLERKQEK